MPPVHRMDHEYLPATFDMRLGEVFYFVGKADKICLILQLNKDLEMMVQPVVIMRVACIVFIFPGRQKLYITKCRVERQIFINARHFQIIFTVDGNDLIQRIIISEKTFGEGFADQDRGGIIKMAIIPFIIFRLSMDGKACSAQRPDALIFLSPTN